MQTLRLSCIPCNRRDFCPWYTLRLTLVSSAQNYNVYGRRRQKTQMILQECIHTFPKQWRTYSPNSRNNEFSLRVLHNVNVANIAAVYPVSITFNV